METHALLEEPGKEISRWFSAMEASGPSEINEVASLVIIVQAVHHV